MKNEPDGAELRALVAFAERYWEDVEGGGVRGLRAYLDLFPGHEEAIAAEYLSMRASHDREDAGSDEGDGTFGPYRIERELGRGGQGIVWLAHDTRLGRKVALKVLTGLGPHPERQVQRFRREAAITSRLAHPGICTVLETGIEGGVPFIAMQYIPGESLAARVARARYGDAAGDRSSHLTIDDSTAAKRTVSDSARSAGESMTVAASASGVTMAETTDTVALFERVARALHVAHESGVTHRDLKPGNIIVTDHGEPVILDFGLARSSEDGQQTLTGTSDVLGTPAYMPPEQIEGAHRIDARSDVYSLGATLYECLTLRRPFEAPTRERLYQLILDAPPPDPVRLNRRISVDLRTVLETALSKDPDRRYRTALDFAEDLGHVRKHEPIRARRTPAIVRMGLWARRNRGAAVGFSVAFVTLVAGLVTSLVFLDDAQQTLFEYDQMSDASLVNTLLEEEPDLWPRRPDLAPVMTRWLARAAEVIERLPSHRAARDQLRDRAGPYPSHLEARDQRRLRKLHPDLAATLAGLQEGIEAKRHALEETRHLRDQVGTELEQNPDSGSLKRRHEHLAERVEQLGEEVEGAIQRWTTAAGDPRLNERLSLGVEDRRIEWRHEVLTKLVRDLETLNGVIDDVRKRRDVALNIRARTIGQHQEAWERCLADLRTSPRYGRNAELSETSTARLRELTPQLGLVPLGRDAHSLLWEFWVEETGPRPPWHRTTQTDGHLDLEGRDADLDFGVVLVLLPGGRFVMGTPLDARPNRREEQPAREITLAPFFVSKFEMTQNQWLRVFGRNPSRRPIGTPILPDRDRVITGRHPVTSVSWHQAALLARRLAMSLPTEAQWEYAARGGTSELWWTGDTARSFKEARAGNIKDRAAALAREERDPSGYDDTFPHTSPVGWFAANPFGLHDTAGNVWEWTRDAISPYDVLPEGEEGRRPSRDRSIIFRGGGFTSSAEAARPAVRRGQEAGFRSNELGIRLSRSLR